MFLKRTNPLTARAQCSIPSSVLSQHLASDLVAAVRCRQSHILLLRYYVKYFTHCKNVSNKLAQNCTGMSQAMLLKEDSSVEECSDMQTGRCVDVSVTRNVALSSLLFDQLESEDEDNTRTCKYNADRYCNSRPGVTPQKAWIYKSCRKSCLI
jgi:hypothetical protein